MISRQVETLLQQSKNSGHLLQLQSLIIKTAQDHEQHLVSKLILASSSISLQLSHKFFDNSPIDPPLFARNILIREYSKSPVPVKSVNMFADLHRSGRDKPDKYTYPFVLKACGRCVKVGVGGSVHSMVLKVGLDWDSHICNTLLRMYGGFGLIRFARQVFDEMSQRNVVSWSSMIAAYVDCNCPVRAVMVFQDMLAESEKPNSVTLVSLLTACTRLLNMKLGDSIHSYILTSGIEFNVELGTALLEVYSKCGHMVKAFRVFDSLDSRNLKSWTAMISGFAENGFGKEAISLFAAMEEAGLQPDSKSFSAILSACSHMGLVEEGQSYFDKMVTVYNIKPTMEHYGCMVDMFGRAGRIEEAYRIVKDMPMEPNSVIMRSFISACQNHGCFVCEDKHLRKLLVNLEPDLGANYVLAGNTGHSCQDDDLRITMKEKGLKKTPGCSWVHL